MAPRPSLVLLVAPLLLLGLSARAAETPAPLTLSGVVTSDNGAPIRNASIFIYTAGPRVGVGFL